MRGLVIGVVAACGGSSPPPDLIDAAVMPNGLVPTIELEEASPRLAISVQFAGPVLSLDARVTAAFRDQVVDVPADGPNRFATFTELAIPLDDDEPVEITLALAGTTAHATATIPVPFTMLSASGTLCNSSDPPTFTWSPTSAVDTMQLVIGGFSSMGSTCSVPPPMTIPDTGTFTLTECVFAAGPGCMTVISLQRVRTGEPLVDGFAPGGVFVSTTR